jgi:hypothetical protein
MIQLIAKALAAKLKGRFSQSKDSSTSGSSPSRTVHAKAIITHHFFFVAAARSKAVNKKRPLINPYFNATEPYYLHIICNRQLLFLKD